VLVRDGQLVDGFSGALPEATLREFIARHVPPGDIPAEEPSPAEAAPAVVESPEQAIARIQQEIAAQPDKTDLKLDLALAQMRAGNTKAAEAELDALPANLATDERAKRLRGQLEFWAVATPTEITTATRIPVRITGTASGSSTSLSRCEPVMPIATAASLIFGSIPMMPVTVLRITGNRA